MKSKFLKPKLLFPSLCLVNTIQHDRTTKAGVPWNVIFCRLFVCVFKKVDSLKSTNGRTIHLFNFLLVIHYFRDKNRRRMSFKPWFSGMLSHALVIKLPSKFSFNCFFERLPRKKIWLPNLARKVDLNCPEKGAFAPLGSFCSGVRKGRSQLERKGLVGEGVLPRTGSFWPACWERELKKWRECNIKESLKGRLQYYCSMWTGNWQVTVSIRNWNRTSQKTGFSIVTEQLFPCQLNDHNEENVTKLYL